MQRLLPVFVLVLLLVAADGASAPAADGVSVEAVYTAEALANVRGGVREDGEFLGNVDLQLSADLQTLFGWGGAELFLYGLGNHGGRPSEDVGDLQGISNIEAPETWKLYEAWIEQRWAGNRLSLRAGLYDLNSEFDVLPAAALFIHSSFGIGAEFGLSGRNGPSIFPATSPGARLNVRIGESTYARGTVLDGVPGDPDDPLGTQVILRDSDGLLLAAELGRERGPSSPASGIRKLAIGLWGYTTDFDDLESSSEPSRSDGSWGIYALAEAGLWGSDSDRGRESIGFLRAGLADDRVQAVDAYLGAGLVTRGWIPGRPEDELGLGLAAAHLGGPYRSAAAEAGQELAAWEIAVELTWSLLLFPWLQLQPDVQIVHQPGGSSDLDTAVLVGTRAVVTF